MPFDPNGAARHDRRSERGEPVPQPSRPLRSRMPMSEDNKMGLVLLVVALLAVGSYTLLVFSGVLGGQQG